MTNLQSLSQRIQKIVPEIMELKFGCKLHHPGYHIGIINDSRGTGNGSTMKFFTDIGHCFYDDTIKQNCIKRNSFESPNEWWEILGRDITLPDVLRAIHKSNPANKTNITLESDGQFIVRTRGENPVAKQWWNLSLPLSGQSPELIEFLLTIIPE